MHSLASVGGKWLFYVIGQLPNSNIALTSAGAISHLTDQLAAGGVNILTTRSAYRNIVAGLIEQILKTADSIVARPLITGMRERVERDQIDLAGKVLEQGNHLDSVFRLIVDILEQRVLNR